MRAGKRGSELCLLATSAYIHRTANSKSQVISAIGYAAGTQYTVVSVIYGQLHLYFLHLLPASGFSQETFATGAGCHG